MKPFPYPAKNGTKVTIGEAVPSEAKELVSYVERISGEAPPDFFVGPAWCLDKPAVRAAIEQQFEQQNTWQGRLASGEA